MGTSLDDTSLQLQILQNVPGIIYVYDLKAHRNVYITRNWVTQFGYSLAETQEPGDFLASIIHPEDHEAVERHHRALETQKGPEVRPLKYRLKRKSGEWVWLESEDRPFKRDADGSVRQILGSARDITREVELQELTRESEERFRRIVETLPDAVFIGDQQGAFIEVNSAACAQLGYRRQELLELGIRDIIAPEYRDRARERLQSGDASGYMQSEHLRKDGSRIPVEVCVVPLQLGGHYVFLGVARDVTERKLLEARVREAERLEAIGRLAGSVAHDFNNLLAVIVGGAELLDDDSLSETQRRLAADVTHAAKRGAELTAQLLTFSRRRHAEKHPLDLGEHVEKTLELVRRVVGESVELQASIEKGVKVSADPGMLDQVIVNLLVNARDAMPRGGVVRISVATADNDNALLVVADTGEGIAPEALSHVFDPFFTTKADGKGTGLGLAAVHGIVHQHHGSIRVESEPGKGSTFTVTLPVILEEPTRPLPKQAAAQATQRCVLVVDDQDLVLKMICAMLTRLGHKPFAAHSAQEAAQLIGKHGADIHLLLTDVSLGDGTSGPAVAKLCLQQRPDLPVIYMSGYDEVLDTMSLVEGRDFLQKPVSLEMLGKAIAQLTLPPH